MQERFYVFYREGQFLCVAHDRKDLYWGPAIENAVRGRSRSKAKSYAARVTGKAGKPLADYLQAAQTCVAYVTRRPCGKSADVRWPEYVTLTALEDGRLGFQADYTCKRPDTPLLSKAKTREIPGGDGRQAMLRHITLRMLGAQAPTARP